MLAAVSGAGLIVNGCSKLAYLKDRETTVQNKELLTRDRLLARGTGQRYGSPRRDDSEEDHIREAEVAIQGQV